MAFSEKAPYVEKTRKTRSLSPLLLLVVLATLAMTTPLGGAAAKSTGEEALEQYVVRIRRELHKIPETCYSEVGRGLSTI